MLTVKEARELQDKLLMRSIAVQAACISAMDFIEEVDPDAGYARLQTIHIIESQGLTNNELTLTDANVEELWRLTFTHPLFFYLVLRAHSMRALSLESVLRSKYYDIHDILLNLANVLPNFNQGAAYRILNIKPRKDNLHGYADHKGAGKPDQKRAPRRRGIRRRLGS